MNSSQPFSWILRPTLQFNWILRPALQLKIKAIAGNEFRPSFSWILRPALQLKIKAEPWNEFRSAPTSRKIQAKDLAENLEEVTWRRLFSFQLIPVSFVLCMPSKYFLPVPSYNPLYHQYPTSSYDYKRVTNRQEGIVIVLNLKNNW